MAAVQDAALLQFWCPQFREMEAGDLSKEVIEIALFLIWNCKLETIFSVVLDVCGVF